MTIEDILGITDKYWSLTFNPGGDEYYRAYELLSKFGYAWNTNNIRHNVFDTKYNESRKDIKHYIHFDLITESKVIYCRHYNSDEHSSFTFTNDAGSITYKIKQIESLALLEALIIINDITI